MQKSAHLSDCEHYRYFLSRTFPSFTDVSADLVSGSPRFKFVTFIGVNPSTADAEVDDATVRKWIGFTARWGYQGFTVVNLFAYRSTQVANLAHVADPVGVDTDAWIAKAIRESGDLIVPCWGSRDKLPNSLHYRIDEVNAMLKGKNTMCFGKTLKGDPMHPLMLGYNTQLMPF